MVTVTGGAVDLVLIIWCSQLTFVSGCKTKKRGLCSSVASRSRISQTSTNSFSAATTMIRSARSLPFLHRTLVQSRRETLSHAEHLPGSRSQFIPKLEFFNSVTQGQIPTYRVLDGVGKPIEGAEIPEVRA